MPQAGIEPAVRAQNPRLLRWQQTLDEGWSALDASDPKAKQLLVEAVIGPVMYDGTVTASRITRAFTDRP